MRWEIREIKVGVDPAAPSRFVKDEEVIAALDAARAVWNGAPEMRAKLVPLTTLSRPDIVVRFCRGAWKEAEGLLGRTEFTAKPDTGVITNALIEINECNFRFVGPDVVRGGRFDLQSVFAHELGHTIGLGHSQDPLAMMFVHAGNGRQRRLAHDDRVGLATIFGLPAPPKDEPAPGPSAARPASPPAQGAAREETRRRPTAAPPPNAVSMVRVEGQHGAEAMVYTCEPTILPPIAAVPAQRKSRGRKTTSEKARR